MPTPARRFKTAVYEHLARVGKALASASRLELLDLLAQSPRSVDRLAIETGQTIANTSQHLQVLRHARLVEAEKQGSYVIYRLADDQVAELSRSLRVLAAARVADLEKLAQDFLGTRGLLEPLDQGALMARVGRGEVTLIDVRPPEEFAAGHIPGAISLPLSELDRRRSELPANRDVVAYCRGPYCVMAIEAVTRLRALGFRAFRMEAGVHDWKARGRRVGMGPAPSRPRRITATRGAR